MRDPFSDLVTFVYVAEERSFRRAAARLELTPAAVSKAIARLEEELGTTLLHRSTRRVDLSDAGVAFLARCEEALRQVRLGREELAMAGTAVTGELRVTVSPVLVRYLAARLGPFTAAHPSLAVRLQVTDRPLSLLEEELDVAVRIGALQDSSLVARKLMDTRWVTVAAPEYLRARGEPKRPEDLEQHNCLKFRASRGTHIEWSFRRSPRGAVRRLRTRGNLDADSGEALVEATLAGVGICQAMDFMVGEHVAAGRLRPILARFAAPGPPVHAVRLRAAHPAPKVRAFVDFVAAAFRGAVPS